MKKIIKKPRKITKKRLENIALFYLQRFSTSSGNLREVLRRRVYKGKEGLITTIEETFDWIDEIIKTAVKLGYINDENYTFVTIKNMFDAGKSEKKIRSYLMQKKVAKNLVDESFEKVYELDPKIKTDAILIYARKKKLGPFSSEELDYEERQKQMQKLARAGFNYKDIKDLMDQVK